MKTVLRQSLYKDVINQLIKLNSQLKKDINFNVDIDCLAFANFITSNRWIRVFDLIIALIEFSPPTHKRRLNSIAKSVIDDENEYNSTLFGDIFADQGILTLSTVLDRLVFVLSHLGGE